LLELANEFLEDEDVQSLARCCSAVPPLLRSYRIKAAVSLSFALLMRRSLSTQLAALPVSIRLLISSAGTAINVPSVDSWLAHMRFGVVSTVFLDARASMDFYLGAQLQRLPLRVCGVRVRREALAVAGRRSALDVVAWQLPAHVRSLIFEHEGLASSGEGCTFDLLPPLSRWTLPAGLTELQLPHFLPLDEEIHKQRSGWVFSDEEEEEEEEERMEGSSHCLLR
jgi:hypothetical protein